MNWFTELRPTARLTRELRLLRLATERIASAAERAYPPVTPVPAAEEPPLEVANAPTDFGALWEVEQALTKQLGREPDADELLRAYDGDPEVVRGRRR